MAIIIIADAPEVPEQPLAPVAPAAPAPVAPRKKKPTLEVGVEDPAASAFYGQMNSLIDQYRAAAPEEQSDWIRSISEFPMQTGKRAGFLTIGDWVAAKFMRDGLDPEDAKGEAQLLIWKALTNLKPGGNLIGWLKAAMEHAGQKAGSPEMSGPESDRFKEAYTYLKPYMLFLKNPDFPEAGSKPIDLDILEQYETGQMTPGQAALAQANRKHFNDYKDISTGKTRIQTAKEKFMGVLQELAAKMATTPRQLQLMTTINNPQSFREAMRLIARDAPEFAAQMKDKESPFWLEADMLFPRGLGPDALNYAWDRISGEPNVSLDKPAEYGDTGVTTLGEGMSEEEYKRQKHRIDKGDISDRQKKTIIEEAPYEYLNLFEDPEELQRIEERLPAIQPYVPVRDAAGNVVMDGKKPRMQKNPQFQGTVQSIIDKLYGPASPRRKVVDDRGRAKGTPIAEERTKEALNMIGQFYAQSLNDPRDEKTRLHDLETALRPLTQQPLVLKHYNGPPLGPNQQTAFALREVMLDLMEYLGSEEFEGQRAVAELKKWLRTSSLLLIARIIARG